MKSSSSPAVVTPTAVQLALRAAADKVAPSAYHRDPAVDPTAFAESIVALLTGSAAAAVRGTSEPRPGPSLTRHHVDELRANLLRELGHAVGSGAVDPAELLRVLMRFERLAERDHVVVGPASTLGLGDSVTAVTEIAHDMRSPLTSILFLVDTILKTQSGPLTPVQERQLRLVYSAAWGLSTLACDVIDASRGHRLLDGRATPFSITETIQSVCEIVRPIAEEKGLLIHSRMPVTDGRLGYSSALARVLLNLASNALRYTEQGSVSIGCTEPSSDRVSFWVEDTGRGMPLVDACDHCAPGRQSAAGPHFSSTGLGLSICRNLLSAMGSSLTFETVASGGTRFSFEINLPPA